MNILMKMAYYFALGAASLMLLIMAMAVCLLLVAAVATKEWLLIPVVLIPIWAFFCLLDSNP